MATPTEGPLDVAGAAETLDSLLASDNEEQAVEEVEEPQADEAEGEPGEETEEEEVEEPEEFEEDEDETDEEDEESDDTRDAGKEADDPLAEKEKSLLADYTRKTQALAEERKKVEAEVQQYRTAREQYAERLVRAEEVLTQLMPAEPDWATLRETDPAEYAAQREDWRSRQEDVARVKVERERIAAEAAAEQELAHAERLQAEKNRLLEALPEWQDESKAATEKKALVDYASSLGFTEQDLASVYDHRVILLLRKAQQFDALGKKVEAVKEKSKAAPVLKPGHRETSPKKGTNVKARIAFDRLKKSGRAEDAAALIERMLSD